MSKTEKNLKLFTGTALSVLLAMQSFVPVYAFENVHPVMKTETTVQGGSKTQEEQTKVKVVLVNADNNKTIAVLEAVPESGQISVSDLKMPKGVQPADKTVKNLKVQDGIVPELKCTTKNKETDLNLTFMYEDKEIGKQSLTQMVDAKNDVEFVQGLNYSLPEGYALAKKQSDDFTKAWSVSDKAIGVPYGKSLNLKVNLVKEAVLNIRFVENGSPVGQTVLELSEEDVKPDTQNQILFDLSSLQAPAGTEFAKAPTEVSVGLGQSSNVDLEVVSDDQNDQNGGQQTPANDNQDDNQFTVTVNYVDGSQNVGSQSLKIDKSVGDGWTLSKDVLILPAGYEVDESTFDSETGPYGVYDQTISVQVKKAGETPDTPNTPETPQTKSETIRFNYVDENGTTVGTSEYTATIESGQTEFTPSEDMLNIPSGYTLKSMPQSVEVSALDQPVVVQVESAQQPQPEQPLNADLKVVYKTEDGTVVSTQNFSTQLSAGQDSQTLSPEQLQVPDGYELVEPVPEIQFVANQTPEYDVTVKAVSPAPELKQARLNLVFKNKFTGELVANQTAVLDQKSADETEAYFAETSFAVPKGYRLSSDYQPVGVPYGETKDLTLEVTAVGEAVVTFMDGSTPVGQTYQYYFEQTKKGETNAVINASDLSVPNGYELAVDASTTYNVPLGTGQAAQISVPVKAKETQKQALAVLRVQYYVQSGSNRQIVSTQTLESPKEGETTQKYTFDFGKDCKLQVPKGYKLKSNASLGKIDIQYGTMGTIQIEVLRDTAHTSTETNWQLYAGLGVAAIAVAGLLVYFSKKNKSKK